MSGVVDYGDLKANMYGCLPCPKCGSKFRAVFGGGESGKPLTVECDECSFKEPACGPEIDNGNLK